MTIERNMVFAAATAISLLGVLSLPAPAHAGPPIPVPSLPTWVEAPAP
jgi:hypothetical protein